MRRGSILSIVICFFLLAADDVRAQELPLPGPAPLPAPAPERGPLADWIVVPATPERKFWSGNVEFGVNGSEGNSQNFKLRAGSLTKYDDGQNIFISNLLYGYASANGIDTQNRFLGKIRYERLFPDSRWSWFNTGEVEYDEFQNFDLRLSGHTGLAYACIKNDNTLLKSRFGAGGSQKIGGPDTLFRPELDLGLDCEHKLTQRTKFVGSIDFYPNMTDFSVYRVEGRAAVDFLIDPEWNITLRLGVLDRYDSNPAGKLPNDIEYYATILWTY